MKKVLFVATVGNFFNFEKSDMDILEDFGYEVHCAANFYDGDSGLNETDNRILHQIDFNRSPYSKQTIVAYRQLKALLSTEHFDIIHCHTPVVIFIRVALLKIGFFIIVLKNYVPDGQIY